MRVHGVFEDKSEFIKEYRRVFILSDLHNDYDKYELIKEKNGWNSKDLLIINGDLIDRGKNANPQALLSEIVSLSDTLDAFKTDEDCTAIHLKGNHESWLGSYMKKYCSGEVTGDYKYNTFSLLLDAGLYGAELSLYAEYLLNLHRGLVLSIGGYDLPIHIAHASTIDFCNEEETIMGPGTTANLFKMCENKDYISIVGHNTVDQIRFYMKNYDFSTEDKKQEENKINNDILHVGNCFFSDCGNGYRDDPDLPGKLGYLELRDGMIIEHYA